MAVHLPKINFNNVRWDRCSLPAGEEQHKNIADVSGSASGQTVTDDDPAHWLVVSSLAPLPSPSPMPQTSGAAPAFSTQVAPAKIAAPAGQVSGQSAGTELGSEDQPTAPDNSVYTDAAASDSVFNTLGADGSAGEEEGWDDLWSAEGEDALAATDALLALFA